MIRHKHMHKDRTWMHCDVTFIREDNYIRHLREVHGEIINKKDYEINGNGIPY